MIHAGINAENADCRSDAGPIKRNGFLLRRIIASASLIPLAGLPRTQTVPVRSRPILLSNCDAVQLPSSITGRFRAFLLFLAVIGILTAAISLGPKRLLINFPTPSDIHDSKMAQLTNLEYYKSHYPFGQSEKNHSLLQQDDILHAEQSFASER